MLLPFVRALHFPAKMRLFYKTGNPVRLKVQELIEGHVLSQCVATKARAETR